MAEAAKISCFTTMAKSGFEHDNGVFEGPVSMIFKGSTNSIAGFESVAPDAKLRWELYL